MYWDDVLMGLYCMKVPFLFFVERPSPPLAVSIVALTSELLEIGWREPTITNVGGIINYEVNCSAVFNPQDSQSL